jgi:hypothetical protein
MMPVECTAESHTQIGNIFWRLCWRASRQDLVEQGDVIDIACEQAECVERGSQVPNSASVNAGEARLEAKHAAERRRKNG